MAISIRTNFSCDRTYPLDIVIEFFCQTKCCGTPVSNGDKLVIAADPDLEPVWAWF